MAGLLESGDQESPNGALQLPFDQVTEEVLLEKPPQLPTPLVLKGDAREIDLPARSVDLVVTSPPYWKKRDYGVKGQLGQEPTAKQYVAEILKALEEWRRVLRATGSVFLNIGDTYWNKSLQGIPSLVEAHARDAGWVVRNRIIWVKKNGMPDPAQNRLASRHEYILHLTVNGYYYDLFGYAQKYGNGSNPGDVWTISPSRNLGEHLAPFPTEIVERAITLACPESVCTQCGQPRVRQTERTAELDINRPQARRALQLAREGGLTAEHIAAIRATGISDAGKALRVQTGTDKNSEQVKKLAREAKEVLGGYFREFTFGKQKTVGWTKCECGAPFMPGVVLDPFAGTGTTMRVALAMGRSAVGVDLDTSKIPEDYR